MFDVFIKLRPQSIFSPASFAESEMNDGKEREKQLQEEEIASPVTKRKLQMTI